MRFGKEVRQLIKISNVTNFPIGLSEIKEIIERSGWEIYSYKDAGEIIDIYNLRTMAESNDSFAAHIGNRTVIFYDENISQLDFPHILAHEIGHIVLGHLDSTEDIYEKERDCECFADELLGYVPFWATTLYSWINIVLVVLIVGAIFFLAKSESEKTNEITSSQSPTQTPITETTYPTSENADNEISVPINKSDTVYITQYGSKYHLEGCQYIRDKDNLLAVTIEKAEGAGYEPCEVCFGDIQGANTE